MTESTPNQPGAAAHAAQSNPYASQFERAERPPLPNLDAQAPELKSSDMQRLNRRALAFLAGIVLLLGVAAIWLFSNILRPDKPPKLKEEVISVPAAPALPATAPLARPAPAIPLATPALPPVAATPPAPQAPTLLEQRMASSAGVIAVGQPDSGQVQRPPAPAEAGMAGGMPGFQVQSPDAIPPNSAYRMKPLSPTSSAQALNHADVIMLRGTYIRCVLETHIISDIPGFSSCIVTEPVYSFTGKRLLLPKGSKVLGKYDTEPNGDRIAVIWDRIVTPTGIDINMASPGVDNLGGAGHPGYLDRHWSERIGSAMLISLLSDAFKYELAKSGRQSTTVGGNGVAVQSPFESNTAQTLQSIANQAVRRSANRPDTVTINQGTAVTVYVAKDVDFSAVVASF